MTAVKKTNDYDYLTAFISLAALIVMAAMAAQFTDFHKFKAPRPIGGTKVAVDPRGDPAGHAKQARMNEIDQRFQQAVMMLHAKQYDLAVTALHRVLALSPRLPEAHLNMGYALLGLKNYKAAHDFFQTATELAPYLPNAYFGLAEVYEAVGEYDSALGAMRSYVHLNKNAKETDKYMIKARAAMWEWEMKLGRLPPAPKSGAVPFPDR